MYQLRAYQGTLQFLRQPSLSSIPGCKPWKMDTGKTIWSLPVQHFHAVYTIPGELHPLFSYNRAKLYNLLFRCIWETLKQFTSNPENRLNAIMGAIMVLHTWTQQLGYHQERKKLQYYRGYISPCKQIQPYQIHAEVNYLLDRLL